MNPILKIEHFYALSPAPQELFNFLHEDFQLPIVWPFQDYGNFASGGLSLGNVVFEVVRLENLESVSTAAFRGMAFEPYGDAQSAATWLKEQKILHSEPQRFPESGNPILWENIFLPTLISDNEAVFICDYKQREQVRQGRASASQILSQRGGGPLGVTGVEKLVVGSVDFKKSIDSWSLLVGSDRVHADVLRFQEGPNIGIVPSEQDSFLKIVIYVASLKSAANYLQSRNLIELYEESSVSIAPSILQGLNLLFVEMDD
jgi:hypothetical protein